jgi:hypothetical protein
MRFATTLTIVSAALLLSGVAHAKIAKRVDGSGGVLHFPETQSCVRRITDSYFGTNSLPLAAQPSETPRRIRRELDSQGRMVFTVE